MGPIEYYTPLYYILPSVDLPWREATYLPPKGGVSPGWRVLWRELPEPIFAGV
jgi:hypothetical protein